MASRVVHYLTNEHPLYLRMAVNSIDMLRKYNGKVKVRLFVVRDSGGMTRTTNHRGDSLPGSGHTTYDFIRLLRDLGVDVISKKPLPDRDGFFHIHRSLFAETREDSFLFVDADTFIFDDVEKLFDDYSEYDYVGLPIRQLKGWDSAWLPFRPYNSAVNLWNNGWVREFAGSLPAICDSIRDRRHTVADWCYHQCDRCTNREEMATSLFVAERNLKHAVWNEDDVRNSFQGSDYYERCKIFHTFTHNWQRGFNSFRRKRLLT